MKVWTLSDQVAEEISNVFNFSEMLTLDNMAVGQKLLKVIVTDLFQVCQRYSSRLLLTCSVRRFLDGQFVRES